MNLDYLMGLAEAAARGSKDPNEKVGCVIAGRHGEVISTGYNGLPIGVCNEGIYDRDFKLKIVQHAEQNALFFAPHERLWGSTLITTRAPCLMCAGTIIQAARVYGLRKVVTRVLRPGSSWARECEEAANMLVANQVLLEWFPS